MWLAGTFKLIEGYGVATEVLDCPLRALSQAEPLAKLVVLKLCGVRGQPGEQSSACGAQAGEESSSQRPPSDAQWDEAGLESHQLCPGVPSPPQCGSLVEGHLHGVHVG